MPLIAGIVLNLVADRAFQRYRTTVKPFETPPSLITDGVFRLSRNPMYLGMVLIVLGIAMLLGSTSALLVAPILAVSLDRMFIVAEERALEREFGEAFQRYRRRVRRWA